MLVKCWHLDMDIEKLGLANVGTQLVGSSRTFFWPNGLVDSFDIIGDAKNILDGTVVCCNYVLHFIVPQTEINELTQESWADDMEFSSKNTVGVDFTVNRCVNNQQLQNKDT